jgi:uncharacterized repeat protein (TIGR03803 family)
MNKMKSSRNLFVIATLMLCLGLASHRVHAQAFTSLYSFNDDGGRNDTDPLDFTDPGTLAQGQDGNIYTTSAAGGSNVNGGTFFKMSPAGVLSVLYAFDPNNDAECSAPWSGVSLGSDGNFHGSLITCEVGFGSGYVFAITPTGGLNLQHNFMGTGDGSQPATAPVEGRDGNYYGTTLHVNEAQGCGTIYQITPAGSLTTLHQFTGLDGCGSYAPLTLASDGNFYGVAAGGGAHNDGVVFTVTTTGQYSVIYNFEASQGGGGMSTPTGTLVQGSDGYLYGTAEGGIGGNAYGVVFKISTKGKLKVLHTFDPTTGDGADPIAGLVQANDGNFYGVTTQGGTSSNCSNGCGIIFRINSKGTIYSKLYDFDGTTGSDPLISLLQHSNGTLYGLACFGGTYNSGVFFNLNAGLSPLATLVSTSGPVGATIGILGQGFTGTKKVMFAGGAASFTVISDAYLTAMVPASAKLGYVSVKTPVGTLKSSKKFIVTP